MTCSGFVMDRDCFLRRALRPLKGLPELEGVGMTWPVWICHAPQVEESFNLQAIHDLLVLGPRQVWRKAMAVVVIMIMVIIDYHGGALAVAELPSTSFLAPPSSPHRSSRSTTSSSRVSCRAPSSAPWSCPGYPTPFMWHYRRSAHPSKHAS